jgi:hypothetical protein
MAARQRPAPTHDDGLHHSAVTDRRREPGNTGFVQLLSGLEGRGHNRNDGHPRNVR